MAPGAVPREAFRSTSTVYDTPAWLEGTSKTPARLVRLTDGISAIAALGFLAARRTSSRGSQGSAGSDSASNAACRLPLTSTLPSGLNPQRAMNTLANSQTRYAHTALTTIGTPNARNPRTVSVSNTVMPSMTRSAASLSNWPSFPKM
eukprot:9590648-Alexandrium_andersonii.AAC.1